MEKFETTRGSAKSRWSVIRSVAGTALAFTLILNTSVGQVHYDPENDPDHQPLSPSQGLIVGYAIDLIETTLRCEGVSESEIEWTLRTLNGLPIVSTTSPSIKSGMRTLPDEYDPNATPLEGSDVYTLPDGNGIAMAGSGWVTNQSGAVVRWSVGTGYQSFSAGVASVVTAGMLFGELAHQDLVVRFNGTGPDDSTAYHCSEAEAYHRLAWFLLSATACQMLSLPDIDVLWDLAGGASDTGNEHLSKK